MNKILDLRFVIGVFFTLIGLLLLGYSLLGNSPGEWNLNKTIGWGYEDAVKINRWCGIVFAIFGTFMILLSFRKDAGDELPKD